MRVLRSSLVCVSLGLVGTLVAVCGARGQASYAAGMRTARDAQDRLSFRIPAGWALATRDRELSTFHQEARGAPDAARLRFVAAMGENPYPESTFSGAHFYVSSTLRETRAQCAAQTGLPAGSLHRSGASMAARTIDGLAANHRYDEHGSICIQFRDDVYTLYRRGACLRFDLARNNFCGGAVSGVRDMTQAQLDDVHQQLETILDSVVFER